MLRSYYHVCDGKTNIVLIFRHLQCKYCQFYTLVKFLNHYLVTYHKLLQVENPAACRGKLTAKPSGKFWIPMPIARFLKRRKIIEYK